MNASYLFSAIVWGAIGLGFLIYGKKQKTVVPLAGGIVLMAVTYLVKNALYMSLAGMAAIAGIYVLKKVL
jgi:hypothetical protein